MDVTDSGITMPVRPSQFEKAYSPMDFTVSEITTSLKSAEMQLSNACFPIEVISFGTVMFVNLLIR